MPDKSFKDVCKGLQECRQQKTPKSIPEIFGIQYKEVYITQWLGYLLDPNKNGLGSLCLMPLNALLLAGGYDEISSDTNIKEIKVYTEYVFENNRRIDIYIETPECLIGIENKICSDEQKNQTHDYSESLKKISDNSKGIYLYPEWNKQVNPKGIFHAVTYKKLHEELMKIDLDDIKDRNHWILNEFMKYVEENLMSFQTLTPMGKLYSLYQKNIEEAADDYDRYIKYIAKQLEAKAKEAGFKWKSINNTVYQINPITNKNYFHFHFEVEFRNEIFLFIHLEKSGNTNKNFQKAQEFFSDKSGISIISDGNKCTLYENKFKMDFESENEMDRELEKIINAVKENKHWQEFAEQYIEH